MQHYCAARDVTQHTRIHMRHGIAIRQHANQAITENISTVVVLRIGWMSHTQRFVLIMVTGGLPAKRRLRFGRVCRTVPSLPKYE